MFVLVLIGGLRYVVLLFCILVTGVFVGMVGCVGLC